VAIEIVMTYDVIAHMHGQIVKGRMVQVHHFCCLTLIRTRERERDRGRE
jgi:hypothetical protein